MATPLELIDQALALLNDAKSQLTPPTTSPVIVVGPSGDLVSVLNSLSGGETLQVDPSVSVTNIVINKPVTIIGGKFLGNTQVSAPNVSFLGSKFLGTTNGQTLLVAGEGTLVEDCDMEGSPIGQHRGILVNNKNITIRNTRIYNIWHSIDTQAIFGYSGTDNLLVEGCYLEASGENIMFGGADPADETLIPKNITIRNNHLFKPLAWRTQAATGCKNLLELKNAKNVLIEDNLFENSFVDAQVGDAIVVTVRNQGGKAPFSTIEDVIFRNNIVRHVAGGIAILGKDYDQPSQTMKRVLFEGNKFEDINQELYGSNGRTILISHGGDQITFRNNVFSGHKINSLMAFTGGLVDPLTNLVVEGNDFMEGSYGIIGDGAPGIGKLALDYYNPSGYVWSNNIVRKGTSGRNIAYPAGTTVI